MRYMCFKTADIVLQTLLNMFKWKTIPADVWCSVHQWLLVRIVGQSSFSDLSCSVNLLKKPCGTVPNITQPQVNQIMAALTFKMTKCSIHNYRRKRIRPKLMRFLERLVDDKSRERYLVGFVIHCLSECRFMEMACSFSRAYWVSFHFSLKSPQIKWDYWGICQLKITFSLLVWKGVCFLSNITAPLTMAFAFGNNLVPLFFCSQ